MEIQENIVNKVAQSGLVSFDLADVSPAGERVLYDIKDNLFHGLILREKDFREFVKEHNWEQYRGKHVAITCTAEAIVPTWAYMLLATRLSPFADTVTFCSLEELEDRLFYNAISMLNMEDYRDKRIVIKGCGDAPVPTGAFIYLTARLSDVAKSVMYGEPCSTVPVFKRKD